MVNKIVSIPGYVHLYRSLLRFYHSSENEIKEMLYVLNTANLDCFGYYHPEICVVQSGPALFSTWLDNMNYRPYRTEIQLHKALVCLKHSVDREFMTVEQREALQKLRCIISNIEYRFYKAFGIEIDDDRTVYNECAFSLVPDEDEPSVCLRACLVSQCMQISEQILSRERKKAQESCRIPSIFDAAIDKICPNRCVRGDAKRALKHDWVYLPTA